MVPRQMVPRQMVPRQMVPRQMVPGQMLPGQMLLGPCTSDQWLARISHKLAGNLSKMLRKIRPQTLGEHCQIDKASAIEGEFALTDYANCPRVCEKCGLVRL